MKRSRLFELNAVDAVSAHGGFRAAAAELGVSASALSHAIASLEQRMGVRLFHRTTRSVSLTEAGEQFIARLRPALREISEAMEATNQFRDTPMGTLRINTSEAAARMVLAPVVLPFLQRYPDMRVDLVTDGRLVDIVAEGFDAGIRLADSVPQEMVAVRFGLAPRHAVVCTPGFLGARPAPRVPDDLLAFECIRTRLPSGTPYRWEFARHGEELSVEVHGALTLDNHNLVRAAALQGAGLGYVNAWMVREDLEAGRLVRVLEDWMPALPDLALYYPGHRQVPAGLRALVALVRESARANTA